MTDVTQRALGKTGVQVSVVGMGGHHLGQVDTVEEAIRLVHVAVDAGINFFDNCWEYHNGKSETILGRALEGRRDKVFLMTKVCTHGRGADLAMRMLEESLRRLRTDHLDLWQVHGMGFDNDPKRAYDKGGVLEALDRAKTQGKVRFVGFTGHKSPDVHAELITRGYAWDAVQMPLNCFDSSFRSFEKKVVPEATKRGIAVLGMKPFCGTAAAVKSQFLKPEQMLRYAMSIPGVAVTITGIDSQARLDQALSIARAFSPMSESERKNLRDKCADVAGDGRHELYKVSLKYDNPEARLAHNFPIDDKQMEVKEELEIGKSPDPPK